MLAAIIYLKFLRRNQDFQSVSRVQFLHEDCHVVLDCFFAYAQPDGNLAVCIAAQQQTDDLFFAQAQLDRRSAAVRREAILKASITLQAKPGVM